MKTRLLNQPTHSFLRPLHLLSASKLGKASRGTTTWGTTTWGITTLGITTLLWSSYAQAISQYHPSGSTLTVGPASNGRTIISSVSNPGAAAHAAKNDDAKFQFGILSSSGVSFEWGELDNIFDEIDAVNDSLSASLNQNNLANADLAAQTTALIDDLNTVLGRIEDNGYATAFTTIQAPLAPLLFNSNFLGGSIVVDLKVSFGVQLTEKSDTVEFDSSGLQTFIRNNYGSSASQTFGDVTVNINNDDIDYSFSGNESTVLLRAAQITAFSVGYSREIGQFAEGDIFAGIRGNLYQAEMYRQSQSISNSNIDSEDLFEDFDSDQGASSSDFGLDAGVLWVKDHYQVGAMLNNINEPEFEYNSISTAGLTDTGIINFLSNDNSYTMERLLTFEGALYSKSRNWVVSATLDANAIENPFGDEYQWMVVSGAYATPSWLIPGFRVGYRKNNAGSKLSYLTAGMTAFKVMNLDLAYSLDKVQVDGSSYPQAFIFNLGFEVPL